LDGFPRTLPQAEALDRILASTGGPLDAVLSLRVAREELIRRLAGRRTCRSCGRMYHVEFDPPAHPGRCDRCGGELFQREDDQEQTVAARLEVYETRTAPVLEYFRRQGILREIDGTGTAEEVYHRIAGCLGVSER
jgi:adenylate kinase